MTTAEHRQHIANLQHQIADAASERDRLTKLLARALNKYETQTTMVGSELDRLRPDLCDR